MKQSVSFVPDSMNSGYAEGLYSYETITAWTSIAGPSSSGPSSVGLSPAGLSPARHSPAISHVHQGWDSSVQQTSGEGFAHMPPHAIADREVMQASSNVPNYFPSTMMQPPQATLGQLLPQRELLPALSPALSTGYRYAQRPESRIDYLRSVGLAQPARARASGQATGAQVLRKKHESGESENKRLKEELSKLKKRNITLLQQSLDLSKQARDGSAIVGAVYEKLGAPQHTVNNSRDAKRYVEDALRLYLARHRPSAETIEVFPKGLVTTANHAITSKQLLSCQLTVDTLDPATEKMRPLALRATISNPAELSPEDRIKQLEQHIIYLKGRYQHLLKISKEHQKLK